MRSSMWGLLLRLATALLAFPSVSWAGYGPTVIGSGGEGVGMGSADIARSHSGIGSNINPAGLTKIANGNLSVNTEVFRETGIEHSDSLGNSKHIDNTYITLFGAGFAIRPIQDESLVFGLAFVGQGGVGFVYKDLLTEAGNEDDLSASFGVFRIAPALAWKPSDKLSLGASLGLNYTEGEQEVFYNTSIAPQGNDPGFAGLDVDEMSGWSVSYRVGLQYEVTKNLTLAAVYASASELTLDNGHARINFDAFGLGRVRYGDADVSGLELAPEVGVGFSWKLSPRWEWAAELNWLNWSESIESSKLVLTRPDNANAPATIVAESPLELRDQYVLSTGLLHHWDENTDLMAGITYGRNPLPAKNMSPIFNIIAEEHLTLGFAEEVSKHWRVIGTLFYVLPKKVEYQNTGLPLGQKSTEREHGVDLTLTLERRW